VSSPPSRGFFSRRPRPDPTRVPPGQYLEDDFPVLSAGPTPHVPLEDWSLEIGGAVEEPGSWTWDELNALPIETITKDIHCVTKWSKLDTRWAGVSLDVLFAAVRPTGDYLSILSYGGYTTNVPLEDATDGKAWIALSFDDEPLESEHGGPARFLIPHLYFWKSAKWVHGLEVRDDDQPGFWEVNGYHNYGDPWREQRYWGD
jgi:DMSO/TMAO reductase YedYZ molybdopterin-dependent catalytic subunit